MNLRFVLPLILAFAAPAHAQEKLLPENIMAIQEALVWAGDYDGALDGSLGGATLTALKQFQAREGAPVKGRINTADVKRLAALADTAKREAGWTLVIDGKSDTVLWIPRTLLPNDAREPDGRVFSSADGALKLALKTASGNLADIHAAALAKAGRTIEQEKLDKTRSIVIGTENGRGFFEFAAVSGEGAKGFVFSYPSHDADRLRPAAIAVANGFIAEPGAPATKKTVRAVPSFVGTYRFETSGRPYPYGVIDVETRDTVLAARDIAVSLVATEPPPPPDAKPQKRKRRPDFDEPFVPKLQIFISGEPVFESSDASSVTRFAELRLVELDPANAHSEVMLSVYDGGAHCCTELTVFSARKDGSWAKIDGGSFDGSPDFPRDLDGDGVFELVNADNAFLGTIDCYACSYAPDEIRRLAGETLADVSADKRFLSHHRARLGEMWNWGWQGAALSQKGFLAGFVAAARRAGQGEDAWAFLESRAATLPKDGEIAFDQSLKAFLERENY